MGERRVRTLLYCVGCRDEKKKGGKIDLRDEFRRGTGVNQVSTNPASRWKEGAFAASNDRGKHQVDSLPPARLSKA